MILIRLSLLPVTLLAELRASLELTVNSLEVHFIKGLKYHVGLMYGGKGFIQTFDSLICINMYSIMINVTFQAAQSTLFVIRFPYTSPAHQDYMLGMYIHGVVMIYQTRFIIDNL